MGMGKGVTAEVFVQNGKLRLPHSDIGAMTLVELESFLLSAGYQTTFADRKHDVSLA
jgi:hypothetical protein